MAKYRDPGQVEKMMKVESDIRKLEQGSKKKTTQKKSKSSPCGQGSVTGSTYGG
jgi:hypothetical protein